MNSLSTRQRNRSLGCTLPLLRRIGAGAASLAIASLVGADDRTIDGSGNNLAHPLWGRANTQLMRVSPATYGDGVSSMGGYTRPNPRAISNAVVAQQAMLFNDRGLSDWVWQWGQFMDHDLDLVPAAAPTEPEPIAVPLGDPVFSFPTIPFNRSRFDTATGTDPANPRQQVNTVTAWIDGSMVYGSDAATAAALREFSGGRLRVTAHATGNLLPMDAAGFFLAGDGRVNEQVGLTAIHTLMVREHNHWAGLIAASQPDWNDERIYQRTRRIVGAEIQSITFNEWLPALLGQDVVSADSGYRPERDPSVANEFAGALFRVGHTMLSPVLQRVDNDGSNIPQGPLALRDAFFSPSRILNEGGIEPLLKGLASQPMQEVDLHIVEDVRSFLFTVPTGGLDLAALNIQRGRDHGLPAYNAVCAAYGLTPASSFDDITSDASVAAALETTYGDVNEVDVWVGGLAEDRAPSGSVGALVRAAILDQFVRARDGDRFWFERDRELKPLRHIIRTTTLADIIRRNTDITNLPANVFVVSTSCPADWNGDGTLNASDLFEFVAAFFTGEPEADFNGDGAINAQDFFDFVQAFLSGC